MDLKKVNHVSAPYRGSKDDTWAVTYQLSGSDQNDAWFKRSIHAWCSLTSTRQLMVVTKHDPIADGYSATFQGFASNVPPSNHHNYSSGILNLTVYPSMIDCWLIFLFGQLHYLQAPPVRLIWLKWSDWLIISQQRFLPWSRCLILIETHRRCLGRCPWSGRHCVLEIHQWLVSLSSPRIKSVMRQWLSRSLSSMWAKTSISCHEDLSSLNSNHGGLESLETEKGKGVASALNMMLI